MTGYGAFVKKEFMEFYRSHKLLIILAVFLLLGMMNPLTAKITPQLVENFMPEGMIVNLGEPTALDSWMQFYKNVPQLGLVVLVILFSGMMSQEYSKGTLINMLTKGLARRSVILSKLTVALVMWTAAYVICTGISRLLLERRDSARSLFRGSTGLDLRNPPSCRRPFRQRVV